MARQECAPSALIGGSGALVWARDKGIDMPVQLVTIADLRDPNDPQGRTYRQVNAEKMHAIPVGALAEIRDTGVRLFVVKQARDCDQEPLYWLTPDLDDINYPDEIPESAPRKWAGGYSEDELVVIRTAPPPE